MEKRNRLRVALDIEHDEQLRWLMDKWGLDRKATVSRVIQEAIKQEAGKDAKLGGG